jgi:DNA-binding NarL/FixJ family response regulator
MVRLAGTSGEPASKADSHERSVLKLIGAGLTSRQIAERLFPAEKT